jgi:hypothetical protein
MDNFLLFCLSWMKDGKTLDLLTSVKLCSILFKSLTIFHMIHIPMICFHIFLST